MRETPATWRAKAACREIDPEVFFPEPGASSSKALAVCAGCNVRPECLAAALLSCETDGTWGGMTMRQRERLRLALRADGRWTHLPTDAVPHPARPAVGLKAAERRRLLAEIGPLRHGDARRLAEEWGVHEASISLDLKKLKLSQQEEAS